MPNKHSIYGGSAARDLYQMISSLLVELNLRKLYRGSDWVAFLKLNSLLPFSSDLSCSPLYRCAALKAMATIRTTMIFIVIILWHFRVLAVDQFAVSLVGLA